MISVMMLHQAGVKRQKINAFNVLILIFVGLGVRMPFHQYLPECSPAHHCSVASIFCNNYAGPMCSPLRGVVEHH